MTVLPIILAVALAAAADPETDHPAVSWSRDSSLIVFVCRQDASYELVAAGTTQRSRTVPCAGRSLRQCLLLKTAETYSRAGMDNEAQAAYDKLIDEHPNSSEAKKARLILQGHAEKVSD